MSNDEVEHMLHEFRKAAQDYAVARAKAETEEHRRKTVLAGVMKIYAEKYNSVAAQEREALASENYAAQLDRCYQARLSLEMAAAAMRFRELEIEVWRTRRADERVERRAYSA